MATLQQHRDQWLRNRRFLVSILDRRDNPDWIVTVTFYTALHAIQMVLVQDKARVIDHQTRNEVLRLPKYGKIWPDYKILYDAALVARYDCTGWLPIDGVLKHLVADRLLRIEQNVLKLTGTSESLEDLKTPQGVIPPVKKVPSSPCQSTAIDDMKLPDSH